MSVVPPLLALFGVSVPSVVTSILPSVSASTGIFGAVLLMYCPHVVRAAATDKYDNTNPRGQLENNKKNPENVLVIKADAAHSNGLETFPLFAAGVLACVATSADQTATGQLISLYLLARTIFNVVYMFGPSSRGVQALRSVAWLAGQITACSLVALGLTK